MVDKVQPVAGSRGRTQGVSRAGHFSGSCGEEFTFKLTQVVGRIQVLADVGLRFLSPRWLPARVQLSASRGHPHFVAHGHLHLQASNSAFNPS